MKRFIITAVLTIFFVFAMKGFYLVPMSEDRMDFLSRFDYKVFIIILSVIYMLIYKAVQYLVSLKINERFSRIDIVFMCFVAVFMFVPMSSIDHTEINKRENRALAKYYDFTEGYNINFEYGKNFEDWFNDRFHFRDEFINANNRINRFINGRTTSDKAMVGLDGWLYSKQYKAVSMFQNDNLFSSKELEAIKENLYAFRDWVESRGGKFYLFLVPDKETIYPEYYPTNYGKVNDVSRMQQVMNFLEKETDIVFVSPVDELLKEKEKQVVYYKTGTHWNEVGAYIGYKKLFKRIKQDFPSLKIMEANDFNIYKRVYADVDIANILAIDAYETYPAEDMNNWYYDIKNPKVVTEVVDFFDKDRGVLHRYMNKDKSKKLNAFFYSDSFFLMSREYAAESFANMELIFIGFGKDFIMNGVNGEAVKDFDADIFVVSTTERFLQRLLHLNTPEDK